MPLGELKRSNSLGSLNTVSDGEIKRSNSLDSLKDAGATGPRIKPKLDLGKLASLAVASTPIRPFDGLVNDYACDFFLHPKAVLKPEYWRVMKPHAIRTNDPTTLTKRLVEKYGFWKNGDRTNYDSEPIWCRHMCMMDLAFRLNHGQQINSNGAREAFFRNVEEAVEYDATIYEELDKLSGAINVQTLRYERVSNKTFSYWVQDKFKHMSPNDDGTLVQHFYCLAQARPVSHAMNIQLKIKLDPNSGKPIYHVSVFDPNNAGLSRKFRYEELYEVAGLELTHFTAKGAHYLGANPNSFSYLMHPISTAQFSTRATDRAEVYLYGTEEVKVAIGLATGTTTPYEFDHDY